jgi:hypothetical protein
MILKDILVGTSSWLRGHKLSKFGGYQPDVDDEGLLTETGDELVEQESTMPELDVTHNSEVVVKTFQPVEPHEPLGEMPDGVDRLVEQLHGINRHLDRQVVQHEELMRDVKKLPELLEGFPSVVKSQRQVVEQIQGQIKAMAARDQRFMDTVAQIPAEAAKQADALVNINHQLAAVADIDVQVAENFNRFNENLQKLNGSANSQTESIIQMGKTFAASDRHLKYMISKQNKRFAWLFMATVGVCVSAILILSGIIMYLAH